MAVNNLRCAYVSFKNDYRLCWQFNGRNFILNFVFRDEWILER